MAKLLNKIIVGGSIELKTGLHIGGNKESFEIGGMDNPVIRDPITNLPYIPGSSIKGRMRSELEWYLVDEVSNNVSNDYRIVDLFGLGANQKVKKDGVNIDKDRPTRLIVRDAYPEGYDKLKFDQPIRKQLESDEFKNTTIGLWSRLDMGLSFTEWKKENTIKRIDGSATPRDMERAPAGSKFNFEFVFIHFKGDNIKQNLDNFREAVCLVEDSYLGGSGSRGCGKVKFSIDKIEIHNKEYYKEGKTENSKEKYAQDDKFNNLNTALMAEKLSGSKV